MTQKSRRITLPCDCKCCMLVIEKTIWEDGDINYNISIQDSRYDHNYNTLWGRLKRAAKTLFGKPIYYSDVYLEGEETFQQLVKDMNGLAKSNFDEVVKT
ncbi:MAG: hypothetical protein HFI90_06255 [Clostridia bacterium]|nr:hypothetical protein [Clostridia bacterium]